MATPVLGLAKIRKLFGGIVAIEELSLGVQAGEIVALVGDNGAGKSTLIKIISGVHQPDSGKLEVSGRAVSFPNPSAARSEGIEVVYQDLALVNNQPVYMNMFLGRELVKKPLGLLDRRSMVGETQELLAELDVRVPSVHRPVWDMSGGQRQGVAIARATHWASKLILLDEPTAALGVAETARVEELIRKLRQRNLAILLVSHNLEQVFTLADRICVLRRGVQMGVLVTKSTNRNEIVKMITGVS